MPSVLELRWPRKLSDRAVEVFRVARGLDILDPERLARFDGALRVALACTLALLERVGRSVGAVRGPDDRRTAVAPRPAIGRAQRRADDVAAPLRASSPDHDAADGRQALLPRREGAPALVRRGRVQRRFCRVMLSNSS